VVLHDEELVRLEGVPAMFSFTDPDGNGLAHLEDTDDSEPRLPRPAELTQQLQDVR
jgi:hypothetical protein